MKQSDRDSGSDSDEKDFFDTILSSRNSLQNAKGFFPEFIQQNFIEMRRLKRSQSECQRDTQISE